MYQDSNSIENHQIADKIIKILEKSHFTDLAIRKALELALIKATLNNCTDAKKARRELRSFVTFFKLNINGHYNEEIS